MTPAMTDDLDLPELGAPVGFGGRSGTSIELKNSWLTLENALEGSTSYGSLKAARELTTIVTGCKQGKEAVLLQPISSLILGRHTLSEFGPFFLFGLLPPPPLIAVEESIESSRGMLDLESDWDGEGASTIAKSTWERTVDFLRGTALNLWTKCGVRIGAPLLVPVPDGSIDIHWKLANRELLINVPADASKWATYYGDNRHGGNTVEGQLDTNAPNHWLLVWLTE
jgi:hypothetical protein